MAFTPFGRQELIDARFGPFRHELSIRFQDVDGAGIIFFARAIEYCSDALFAALAEFGYPGERMMRERTFVTPVKHVQTDYLAPLRFGDRVEVSVVRLRLEPTQFTIGYRIERLPERTPAVVCQALQVCVDPQTFRRSEMPREFVEVLARIAGLPAP
jgi:YbgC/YbaW family acyl-CoA thioester hydrolase